MKLNNGLKFNILNLIELTFSRAYLSLKLHILFSSNDMAIWLGLLGIRHIKSIIVDSRPYWIQSSWNFSGHISTWNNNYSNGLAFWHGFSDIAHNKVDHGHWSRSNFRLLVGAHSILGGVWRQHNVFLLFLQPICAPRWPKTAFISFHFYCFFAYTMYISSMPMLNLICFN